MALKDIIRQFAFSFSDRLALFGIRGTNSKILLLVKTDAIGDYVLFRNFIEIIRTSTKYGDYRIVLCGNHVYKELAESLDEKWIERFIWIDKKRMVRDFIYRFKKIREIGRVGASVAFNPVFSRDFFSGDSIIKASNAKIKIGCVADKTIQRGRQLKKSDRYYTCLIGGGKETVFEFSRNKKVVEEFLDQTVEIRKPFIDHQAVLIHSGSGTDFCGAVIINPSASSGDKRWNPSKFAALVNRISEYTAIDFIIVGSKADQHLAEHIIRESLHPERVKDLTGQTSLIELAALISRSKLVISNDTATVHFGAAVNISVVCISKGDHFGRFTEYPLTFGDVTTVYPREIMSSLANKESLFEKYRYHSPLDIDTISVDEVFSVVRRKLAI